VSSKFICHQNLKFIYHQNLDHLFSATENLTPSSIYHYHHIVTYVLNESQNDNITPRVAFGWQVGMGKENEIGYTEAGESL
jgi:hypothetical protein